MIVAKFKIWKSNIRYRLKVFRMCWFWAYTSRFYTWPENIQILRLGIWQKKPKKLVFDYYLWDVPRIDVVEILAHWSARESMWKAKINYDIGKINYCMSVITMERFERHFKMWGELHGWST